MQQELLDWPDATGFYYDTGSAYASQYVVHALGYIGEARVLISGTYRGRGEKCAFSPAGPFVRAPTYQEYAQLVADLQLMTDAFHQLDSLFAMAKRDLANSWELLNPGQPMPDFETVYLSLADYRDGHTQSADEVIQELEQQAAVAAVLEPPSLRRKLEAFLAEGDAAGSIELDAEDGRKLLRLVRTDEMRSLLT